MGEHAESKTRKNMGAKGGVESERLLEVAVFVGGWRRFGCPYRLWLGASGRREAAHNSMVNHAVSRRYGSGKKRLPLGRLPEE